jgi:lysophospholipase L1-like esterase
MSRIAATRPVWPSAPLPGGGGELLRHNRDTAAATPGRGHGTVGAMTTSSTPAAVLAAGLLLLTTACAGRSAATPEPVPSTVLLLGDSVAAGEALPLGAALEAGGVGFVSLASDGGGNVVGPFADENWADLPERIASADPTVVVYQLTTYDWGTREQQRAAYDRLLTAVTDAGAELVFVTMPPIRPDEFYQPHMAELAHADDAARQVAATERATVLDAGAVWGSDYRQTRDGRADRSTDGIHTCPQGAARFTSWLLARLAELVPGVTPAPAREWANTGWAADEHFTGC